MGAFKRGGANHEHVRSHQASYLLHPEQVTNGTTEIAEAQCLGERGNSLIKMIMYDKHNTIITMIKIDILIHYFEI